MKLIIPMSMFGALMLPMTGSAQAPCAPNRTVRATRFHVEVMPAGPRDTVTIARLCLTPDAKGVGSYMAVISYDSTRVRAARVDAAGGMQVANARVPGTIRIAGASPGGFAAGPLASMVFKPVGSRPLDKLALTVTEVTTPAGGSVLGEAVVDGWPAKAPRQSVTQPPKIDSISPRTAVVGAERVTDLVLYGRGFAASGNTVLFDGAPVTGLLSESGGTVLRFTAPTFIPGRGTESGHRVSAGRVLVRVRHAGGTSNAVAFIVREDEP
jgi:hypothetical protein